MLVVGGSETASAATPRNGVCEAGEVCFYYLDNRVGSLSDFTTSVANYGTTQPTCYEFKSAGAGQGLCIKNNARSAWNRSSSIVRVYFNSYYGGSSDPVAPHSARNLSVTRDDNASHRFL
ncbi:MAG: peptidase inhibitor family I36 protein [Actinomycetota bacterium]|nr:peptidase inhibitor family I36 protein [Actinomycetota bacterium]